MKHLAIAAALAALALPAAAADLPTLPLKAPALAVAKCTLTNCSAFYAGLDVTAAGTGLDVFGAGGLNTGNMKMGVHGGYQYWNGNYFLAAEVGCQYDMMQNTGAIGGAISNRLSCNELFDAGMQLAGLFGIGQGTQAHPGQGPVPINVPAGLSNALVSPFMTLGAAQRWLPGGVNTGTVTGMGARFLIASDLAMTARYLHTFWNDPTVAPGIVLKSDDSVRVAIEKYF